MQTETLLMEARDVQIYRDGAKAACFVLQGGGWGVGGRRGHRGGSDKGRGWLLLLLLLLLPLRLSSKIGTANWFKTPSF